jgi:hypothetical protein
MTITLEKARKLLPKGYKISDEKLTKLVAECYQFADFAIDVYLDSKKKSKDLDKENNE